MIFRLTMLSERRTKLSLVFEVVKIQEIQEIEANKLRNGVLLIKTIGMQKNIADCKPLIQ